MVGAARRLSRLGMILMAAVAIAGPAWAKAKPKKVAAPETQAIAPEALPTVQQKTALFEKRGGFFTFYVDAKAGKIWLALPPPAADDPRGELAQLIYVEAISTGLGSNPVGLDRGQSGESRWLRLRRVGHKVIFEQANLAFRALTEDPDEQRAAEESFATSVLWAAELAALDKDGACLIDFTPFLLRDAHQIAAQLKITGQGEFELDAERSVVDLRQALAFPDNLEFEALLTFTSPEPGPLVVATAPDARSISFVQHHSLVRPPPAGYRPRVADPRIGMFGIQFHDYAIGLDQAITTRWISRHRLEKIDPTAARSAVKKPIVFYVDAGAPEPIRGALVEGAGWWARAFEEAGFIDAFKVEVLPPDKHPLDIRFNVVQWVHRSTRGWSYGGGVIDPRTGEILKGAVTLGSLRIRQDRLIFEGLLGTEKTGTGAPDDPIQLALARIRQLAAHEVGHALGITHNFAASTYQDRASVMDYPAPWITLDAAGELDTGRAFGVGVGAWDRHTVVYGYRELPPGADEAVELAKIIRQGLDQGLLFLTDQDARAAGSSDPRANLWDNGADPVQALELAVKVRDLGLSRFGERNIRPGRPLAELHEVLVPLYLHHRYQVEAAAKLVAGVEYHYAVRGDGQVPTRTVEASRQRRALKSLLKLLEPGFLDLPEPILQKLAPRPFGWTYHAELFPAATAPTFDGLGAAEVAAGLVFDQLIQPERLSRAIDQNRRDGSQPGAQEILRALADMVFGQASEDRRLLEIQKTVQRSLVERVIIAAAEPTSWSLRTEFQGLLNEIRERCLQAGDPSSAFLASEILRFQERPQAPSVLPGPPVAAPPGSPIGQDDEFFGCSRPFGEGLGQGWPARADHG